MTHKNETDKVNKIEITKTFYLIQGIEGLLQESRNAEKFLKAVKGIPEDTF